MRVLVTVSPRIYREALELSLRNNRPDIEVRATAPRDAESELAGFRPHLLVCNDTDDLGSGDTASVLCRVEMLHPDGIDTRVRTGRTVFRVHDLSTEDLLRAVDVTATVGVLH
jgi:hypothetical protein